MIELQKLSDEDLIALFEKVEEEMIFREILFDEYGEFDYEEIA